MEFTDRANEYLVSRVAEGRLVSLVDLVRCLQRLEASQVVRLLRLRDDLRLVAESQEFCVQPSVVVDYIAVAIDELKHRSGLVSLLRIVDVVESENSIRVVDENLCIVVVHGDRVDVGGRLDVSRLQHILLSADDHLSPNRLYKVENLLVVGDEKEVSLLFFDVEQVQDKLWDILLKSESFLVCWCVACIFC